MVNLLSVVYQMKPERHRACQGVTKMLNGKIWANAHFVSAFIVDQEVQKMVHRTAELSTYMAT
jgi:hypothetical protein